MFFPRYDNIGLLSDGANELHDIEDDFNRKAMVNYLTIAFCVVGISDEYGV